jgi:phage terminase large subunit-like protein
LGIFKKSFVDWIEEDGFYIKDTWDHTKGKWGGRGRLDLIDIQKRILTHVLTLKEDETFPYTTVVYSCVKKSGKTLIGAAISAWFAENAPDGTECYICANDLEQAEGRVMKDVKYHYDHCDREELPKQTQYEVKFRNGTTIQSLSQSFRSNAGARQALVTYDELWGATSESSRRMWDEMTPIPTVPYSLRLITTYAGFLNESDLLWELYLSAVGPTENPNGRGKPVPELADIVDSMGNPMCFYNGKTFIFWSHEPLFPWQSEEYYDQQALELRPSAYLRLHENRWVTTHENFIPIEWWDRAAEQLQQSAEIWQEHPYFDKQVFIGVDAAPKRDCTACVGIGYDPKRGKVGVMFHKIWTPKEGELFDLEITLENYIREMSRKFRIAQVIYDPAHMSQTVIRLKAAGITMREYTQSVNNMTLASQRLYDLFKANSIEAYPSDEIRNHILNAVAQQESRGFRIVKQKDAKYHFKPNDAAIALAMACYAAVEGGGIDISTPIIVQSPFGDVTGWRTGSRQPKFGWPFNN